MFVVIHKMLYQQNLFSYGNNINNVPMMIVAETNHCPNQHTQQANHYNKDCGK